MVRHYKRKGGKINCDDMRELVIKYIECKQIEEAAIRKAKWLKEQKNVRLDKKL